MMVTVTDVPEAGRYEARVDGARAGLVTYRREGGQVVLLHTEVGESYEGKGVGSALARAALDGARSTGLRVVPECPFIAGWIARHPDYADLVADSSNPTG